ncbi:MAG: hypothetical protein H0W71_06190 [Sphingomonas sp.]|nr:hypothetical protein [Sphingomonas sp.]
MSEYQPLTLTERRLPILLIANLVPFLLGLLGLAIASDDGLEAAHWGLEEYFLVSFIAYLPTCIAFLITRSLIELPPIRRQSVVGLLTTWGGINLINCGAFLYGFRVF